MYLSHSSPYCVSCEEKPEVMDCCYSALHTSHCIPRHRGQLVYHVFVVLFCVVLLCFSLSSPGEGNDGGWGISGSFMVTTGEIILLLFLGPPDCPVQTAVGLGFSHTGQKHFCTGGRQLSVFMW